MALRSLILALLILASASPARAQSCDFSGAVRVVVSDYTTWTSGESVSPEVIAEPSTWDYPTFWQGYDSATPFGAFYDHPMRYLAVFSRDRQAVGMIEVRMNAQRAYILMMDEDGKVAGSNVWHGCAALIVELTGDVTPLAWFVRNLHDTE